MIMLYSNALCLFAFLWFALGSFHPLTNTLSCDMSSFLCCQADREDTRADWARASQPRHRIRGSAMLIWNSPDFWAYGNRIIYNII